MLPPTSPPDEHELLGRLLVRAGIEELDVTFAVLPSVDSALLRITTGIGVGVGGFCAMVPLIDGDWLGATMWFLGGWGAMSLVGFALGAGKNHVQVRSELKFRVGDPRGFRLRHHGATHHSAEEAMSALGPERLARLVKAAIRRGRRPAPPPSSLPAREERLRRLEEAVGGPVRGGALSEVPEDSPGGELSRVRAGELSRPQEK